MKTMGIIGGMGPMATVDLFNKIVALTEAGSDGEHIHIYIDNNTSIPDRTAFIIADGKDPRIELIRSAIKLESMGADFLVMPCNTAHCFLHDILPYISIPFINMIEETAKELRNKGIKKIGLLATDGTLKAGIYKNEMDKYRISVVYPSPEGQKSVLELIYSGVKASNRNYDIAEFMREMGKMQQQGVECFVLGCTELPLAFEMYGIEQAHINPTAILAVSAIRFAGKNVRVIC